MPESLCHEEAATSSCHLFEEAPWERGCSEHRAAAGGGLCGSNLCVGGDNQEVAAHQTQIAVSDRFQITSLTDMLA